MDVKNDGGGSLWDRTCLAGNGLGRRDHLVNDVDKIRTERILTFPSVSAGMTSEYGEEKNRREEIQN